MAPALIPSVAFRPLFTDTPEYGSLCPCCKPLHSELLWTVRIPQETHIVYPFDVLFVEFTIQVYQQPSYAKLEPRSAPIQGSNEPVSNRSLSCSMSSILAGELYSSQNDPQCKQACHFHMRDGDAQSPQAVPGRIYQVARQERYADPVRFNSHIADPTRPSYLGSLLLEYQLRIGGQA